MNVNRKKVSRKSKSNYECVLRREKKHVAHILILIFLHCVAIVVNRYYMF